MLLGGKFQAGDTVCVDVGPEDRLSIENAREVAPVA